jgi:hypothetical protein
MTENKANFRQWIDESQWMAIAQGIGCYFGRGPLTIGWYDGLNVLV